MPGYEFHSRFLVPGVWAVGGAGVRGAKGGNLKVPHARALQHGAAHAQAEFLPARPPNRNPSPRPPHAPQGKFHI